MPKTRELIITKAKDMFYEKGYQESSMRDLAKEVNIKAPSFYNYFKSKDDILDAICNEVVKRFEIMKKKYSGIA